MQHEYGKRGESMRRTTLVLIIFLLVVGLVVGLTRLVRSQPSVELHVAVHPVMLDWVSDAVATFNATNPLLGTQPMRFVVESVEDIDVWLDGGAAARDWTIESHPVVWIPAWSTSVNYASRQPYQIIQSSLARTPLVWGGFQSRVAALTADGDAFDWARVASAAEQGNWSAINPSAGFSNNNLTLAFNRPTQTTSGMAVLLSGAAAFSDTFDLVGDDLTLADYRQWITPVLESVPNYDTLGSSPAQSLATRGASLGEMALLPEADWLRNLRGRLSNADDPLVLSYPAYPFVFDFPMTLWSGALPNGVTYTSEQVRTAVGRLASALMSPSGQLTAQSYGLRPALGAVDPASPLFAAGVAYGAQIDADLFTYVRAPALNDMQRLLTWTGGIIR